VALTITPMWKWAWGASEFFAIILTQGDASYPAGGYPLAASLFFLNTFASTSDYLPPVLPIPNPVGIWADNSNTGAALGGYAAIDAVTGNLRLFVAAGTEVGTGLTAATFKTSLVVFGH
jgi:hypothetical protein